MADTSLKDQITKATDELIKLDNELQAAVVRNNNARAQAQECQRKRDEKSSGLAKNKACHIETLSALNLIWRQTEAAMVSLQAQVAAKQAQLQKLQDEAKENANIALQTYQATPEYQNNVIQSQKDKLDKDFKVKVALIAGCIIVVVIIGIIVIKKFF